MHYRKNLAALLSALLLLGLLTACGGEAPTPSAQPAPEASPAATAEPTPEASPEPTPEPTPAPTPAPTPEPTPEPAAPRGYNATLEYWPQDALLGAAFLGYAPEGSSPADLPDWQAYRESFGFPEQPEESSILLSPGGEWYAIFPACPGISLRVYEAAWDETDWSLQPGALLWEDDSGKALFLRCNESEIMPNLLVEAGDGVTFLRYQPCRSMADGSLSVTEEVYDCTDYSLQEAFLFTVIADPELPEYRSYEGRADTVSTPMVGLEEPVPPLVIARKNLEVRVELLQESGEADVLFAGSLLPGEGFFLAAELMEERSPLQVCALSEDGRSALWEAVWEGFGPDLQLQVPGF